MQILYSPGTKLSQDGKFSEVPQKSWLRIAFSGASSLCYCIAMENIEIS